MKVSVVGLGKLGACLLAVLSTKHDVIGIDKEPSTVAAINRGEPPVVEPGLAELLQRNRGRYHATSDFDAVAETDVTFIIVPTPSNTKGEFVTAAVVTAVSGVGAAIRRKQRPHLVVITSTVMPGATMEVIAPALRANAAKQFGPMLAIAYSPEFIALGNVIHDMQHPDMVLIGASDTEAGDRLQRLLTSVILTDAPVARLTIPEAEIAKLTVNCMVTTKLSTANTLAELCETVPNTDAANVAAAVGLDKRIGPAYMKPASAFGGPCFPRDGEAFVAFAAQRSQRAPIAQATVDVNERQVDRLANLIELVTEDCGTVGILGMAYKPNTPVVERAVGLQLADELYRRDFHVAVHDPLAAGELEKHFDRLPVRVERSPYVVLRDSSTIVVAQPCDEYLCLHQHLLGRTVVDLWNLYGDPRFLRPGVYRWGMP